MERLSEQSILVRGESFVVRADRTMYWAKRRLLIVADVHIGKSESFRERGLTLPDGVLRDDLARLSDALSDTGATELLVLGDLIHDVRGLTPRVDDTVRAWRAATPLTIRLVLGNHDARAVEWSARWRIDVIDAPLIIDDHSFTHDQAASDRFNWSGHVHPAVTLAGGGDRVRLPCFVIGDQRAILPAFSTFTGGAPFVHEQGDRVIAIAGKHVVTLPTRIKQ